MPKVAVFRTGRSSYSSEWRDSGEFPEKADLRALGRLLGDDEGNPFRHIVEPGQDVVVKPNWVLDRHPYGHDIFSVVTHSSVLRAVVDLVYEALRGNGTITIADAPQWNCDFENLLQVTEVERIADFYREHHGFEVQILDLRQIAAAHGGWVKSSDRVALSGDPRGYAVVDFGPDSAFVGLPNMDRIYGADYNRAETRLHHNADRHEYLVSKTMLGADVVVHVPKLKVHKKVGVTLNAKGMVGINGNKNWLAHYRVGSPATGGDEFPDGGPAGHQARARIRRLVTDHLLAPGSRGREVAFEALRSVYQVVKPLVGGKREAGGREVEVEGGNWYGNDTAWRMTVDLARAILYSDSDGRICQTPQRRFFSVVDGIVCGEEEGPLSPTPKTCGVLLGGESLLGVDLVGARLMGFDWRKLQSLRWLVEQSPQDMGVAVPHELSISSNVPEWAGLMRDPSVSDLAFAPHPRWRGHVELARETSTSVETG